MKESRLNLEAQICCSYMSLERLGQAKNMNRLPAKTVPKIEDLVSSITAYNY